MNGQPVRFVVDTGATGVALTEEDAKRAGVSFDPASFEHVGQGAAGPIQGQRVNLASIVLDGKERLHVSGAVLQGSDISLLGQLDLSPAALGRDARRRNDPALGVRPGRGYVRATCRPRLPPALAVPFAVATRGHRLLFRHGCGDEGAEASRSAPIMRCSGGCWWAAIGGAALARTEEPAAEPARRCAST